MAQRAPAEAPVGRAQDDSIPRGGATLLVKNQPKLEMRVDDVAIEDVESAEDLSLQYILQCVSYYLPDVTKVRLRNLLLSDHFGDFLYHTHNKALQRLVIQGCKLKNEQILDILDIYCPHLLTLDLSYNRLCAIQPKRNKVVLKWLEELYLQQNELKDLQFLNYIGGRLRVLNIEKQLYDQINANGATEYSVLSRFRRLHVISLGISRTEEERMSLLLYAYSGPACGGRIGYFESGQREKQLRAYSISNPVQVNNAVLDQLAQKQADSIVSLFQARVAQLTSYLLEIAQDCPQLFLMVEARLHTAARLVEAGDGLNAYKQLRHLYTTGLPSILLKYNTAVYQAAVQSFTVVSQNAALVAELHDAAEERRGREERLAELRRNRFISIMPEQIDKGKTSACPFTSRAIQNILGHLRNNMRIELQRGCRYHRQLRGIKQTLRDLWNGDLPL